MAASLLLIFACAAAADEQFKKQEIFVPAISEGTVFTAPADGHYLFTITGGAARSCPPNAAPEHPEWHGWNTRLLIYKNRGPEWGGGPHAPEHPQSSNWDLSVGESSRQPTIELAEQRAKGLSGQIFLRKNEYVTLLVWDAKGYFHDNSGGIRLSVSLVPPAGRVDAEPIAGSACDTFDLLGEGKELIENFSGTETARFGWDGANYQVINSNEQFQYEPGSRQAFGERWDFAPLGTIRTFSETIDFGTTLHVWKSERYGGARGRTLCDQTEWEPSIGPRIRETFRLVGTVDKPFSAPFIPDTSPYDIAWELYQTVTDVRKTRNSEHGEYVSQVTWELNGSVYAKPKPAFANRRTNLSSRTSFQTGFNPASLDEWEILSGRWTITDGVLSSSGFSGEEIILSNNRWKNCRISFRMRFVSGVEDFWVKFRSNYGIEPPGYSYYQIDGGTAKFRYQNIKEKYRDISKLIPAPLGDNKWHTYELVVNGPTVECFKDGNLTVSTKKCPVNVGQIGFRTYNTKVEIDDVSIETVGN